MSIGILTINLKDQIDLLAKFLYQFLEFLA